MFKYNNKVYRVVYSDLSKSNKDTILCKDLKNNIYVIYIDINLSEKERQKALHRAVKWKKSLKEIKFKDYKIIKGNVDDIEFKRSLKSVKKKLEQIENFEDKFIQDIKRLNALGQAKVLEYINDLLGIDKYN